MNRFLWVAAIALSIVGFAPASARAFDIPGMGDSDKDKEKKKKKKKDDAKKDDSGGDSTAKADSKTSKDDSNSTTADTAKPAGGAADGDNKQANIEAMIETCLAAYNADDVKTMAPNFANAMNSYGDRYTKYKEKYGSYTVASKKGVKVMTRFNSDNENATLGFNGEFAKVKKVGIYCDVRKKDGKWMIINLDFVDAYNVPEDASASNDGKLIQGGTQELKMPRSAWDAAGTYFKDMKVGDFIEMGRPETPGMKDRTEVVEVGDHTVTTLSRIVIPGQPTHESKTKQIFSEPDPEVKEVKEEKNEHKFENKTFDDKVKIGNKGEFAATRTESYMDGKLVMKMWGCKEVPLGGMVKMEDPDGNVMQQLLDFGRGK
jgi:hypothetical protein